MLNVERLFRKGKLHRFNVSDEHLLAAADVMHRMAAMLDEL